jgi:hypothetical protein
MRGSLGEKINQGGTADIHASAPGQVVTATAAASHGNVVPIWGLGNHVNLRGLLGGAEGIRTLSPPI